LELRDVVQDPLTGAFGALLQLKMPLMVPGVQFCNSLAEAFRADRGFLTVANWASRQVPPDAIGWALSSPFAAWFPGGATSFQPYISCILPLSEPCLRY